jgi:hypothetical protein
MQAVISKPIRSLFLLLAVNLLTATSPLAQVVPISEQRERPPLMKGIWNGHAVEYLDGMVIVQAPMNVSSAGFDQLLEQRGYETVRKTHEILKYAVIRVPEDKSTISFAEELNRSNQYIFVEPYLVSRVFETPSEYGNSNFDKMWYLENTGQVPGGSSGHDIKAIPGWDYEKGGGTICGDGDVAILDTGMPIDSLGYASHEENDLNKFIYGVDSLLSGYKSKSSNWLGSGPSWNV